MNLLKYLETILTELFRSKTARQLLTTIIKVLNYTGGNMKSLYTMLVLMILLTGCSTSLTTRQRGASMGPTVGHGPADIQDLKRDRDVEASRGHVTD